MLCFCPGMPTKEAVPKLLPAGWSYMKVPDSARKAGVEHKPYGLHSLGTVNNLSFNC